MSLSADLTRLIVGLLIGMILPRFPLLFFTRFLNMERQLTPHPDPIPVDIPLIQRLLLMRRVHAMCWIVAALPLILGLLIIKSTPDPFALGMVAGVSWFVISRAIPQTSIICANLKQFAANVNCCNGKFAPFVAFIAAVWS